MYHHLSGSARGAPAARARQHMWPACQASAVGRGPGEGGLFLTAARARVCSQPAHQSGGTSVRGRGRMGGAATCVVACAVAPVRRECFACCAIGAGCGGGGVPSDDAVAERSVTMPTRVVRCGARLVGVDVPPRLLRPARRPCLVGARVRCAVGASCGWGLACACVCIVARGRHVPLPGCLPRGAGCVLLLASCGAEELACFQVLC